MGFFLNKQIKMPVHNAVFGKKLGHYSLLRTSSDLNISYETPPPPPKVSKDTVKQESLFLIFSSTWTKQNRYFQELIHFFVLLFGVQITCA